MELLYNDSKQTSISLQGVKAGVQPSWGVQDGGGTPGGIVTPSSSWRPFHRCHTHLKHVRVLSTNHTSKKPLKSRYLYSLFRSQDLTDSHAQTVGRTFTCSCPGRDPG